MDYSRESVRSIVARRVDYLRGFGVLLAIAIVGLFIVKWSPYWAKLLSLVSHPTYGTSIIYGKTAVPPQASIEAAFSYSVSYFQAIWQAMVLGLLLAATIETLVPRDWLARVLGVAGWRSTALGGLMSLPGMMCSCCTAPVAIGLRQRGASTSSAVAFFLGNPTLNPAVLAFIGVTLGWQWAALRLVFGVLLVGGLSMLAGRVTPRVPVAAEQLQPDEAPRSGNLLVAWLQALVRLAVRLIPEYILIVAALGALRVFLFPALEPSTLSPWLLLLFLAIAGTLFVIPTGGELPVVGAMLAAGLGAGPAGVLLLTLAPVSLPSLAMVGRVFPRRVLVLLGVGVAVVGLAAGVVAAVLGLSAPPLQ